MGIQTMGSQSNGQGAHFQPSPLTRQSSLYNLTLEEVGNQLGDLGKPVGSMNLDEILKNLWTAEESQCTGMDLESDNTGMSTSSLQRQASLTLARAFSGKTVDEVWKDIQRGQNKKYGLEMRNQSREPTLSEMTLEDFLVQAGLFVADASLGPSTDINSTETATTQILPQISLQEPPSMHPQTNVPASRRRRDDPDAYERTLERRLKRKIKNRESAARSRARKQAYHNELVSKVSRLEEENLSLKKEKEFEQKFPGEVPSEPKYQLRRTSSTSF